MPLMTAQVSLSLDGYYAGPKIGLVGNEATELTPTRVIDTPDVTHIGCRVGGLLVLGGDRPD